MPRPVPVKSFVIASTVAVAATALVCGAGIPAFADATSTPTSSSTSTASSAPKTPKTLAEVKTAVAAAATKRTTALDAAISRLNGDSFLSSAHKSTLLSRLNSDLASVKSDASKVAADSTLTSAHADAKSMISGLRIFAVAIPQARVVAAADRVTGSVIPKMEKAQARLTADLKGKDASKSTAALQADLADMSKQIDAAKSASGPIAEKALAVTPATFNSNHDAVKNIRASVKSIRAELKKAHSDAKAVRAVIRPAKASGGATS